MSKFTNIKWTEHRQADGRYLIQGIYKDKNYPDGIGKAILVPVNAVGDLEVHKAMKKIIEMAIAQRIVEDGDTDEH